MHTVKMRSKDSGLCTATASRVNTWFATARKKAVDSSRKPMIISISMSNGSGASPSEGSVGSDLRAFLLFFLGGGANIFPTASTASCS
jgi:hypothetical protein